MKYLLVIIFILFMSSPVLCSEKISMRFDNINIFDAAKALAQKDGLNIVITDNPSITAKRVSLDFKDVSALEAIDSILSANGLSFQINGKNIIISTLPADLANSAYRQISREIRLKYISSKNTASIITKIFPNIIAQEGDTSHSLILKGKLSDLNEAQDMILKIDFPKPQVLIESKVVEISESGMKEIGVTYGTDNGVFKFIVKPGGIIQPAADISFTVKALITSGKAKVIASPRISVVDNQEASINIGSKIPYAVPVTASSGTTTWAVQYIDAGVSLKILPHIGSNNMLSIDLHPEVSSISEWRMTSAGEFPVISTRNADTSVQVKDGETIAIGGLINESDRNNLTKIPFLGDIPLIGLLFQKQTTEKTRTDIVFLITPHIL